MALADWVERRKRKKAIIEEFVDIRPSMKIKDSDGQINDEEWRKWKALHCYTSATWDFFSTALPTEYFTKRLKNEGKTQRATYFAQKGFPTILLFLQKFLKMKAYYDWSSNDVYI